MMPIDFPFSLVILVPFRARLAIGYDSNSHTVYTLGDLALHYLSTGKSLIRRRFEIDHVRAASTGVVVSSIS